MIKRIFIGVAGGALLLVGLAMVFLPGPAIIVIPAALAILATEFQWAHNLNRKVRGKVQSWRAKRGKKTSDAQGDLPA